MFKLVKRSKKKEGPLLLEVYKDHLGGCSDHWNLTTVRACLECLPMLAVLQVLS